MTLIKGKRVLSVSWCPSGDRVALGFEDGLIHVLTPGQFEIASELRGHTGAVLAMDWSPDGERLASGSNDHQLRIWNAERSKTVIAFEYDVGFNTVSWSPDGRRLAAIDYSGHVSVFDATLGFEIERQTPR